MLYYDQLTESGPVGGLWCILWARSVWVWAALERVVGFRWPRVRGGAEDASCYFKAVDFSNNILAGRRVYEDLSEGFYLEVYWIWDLLHPSVCSWVIISPVTLGYVVICSMWSHGPALASLSHGKCFSGWAEVFLTLTLWAEDPVPLTRCLLSLTLFNLQKCTQFF